MLLGLTEHHWLRKSKVGTLSNKCFNNMIIRGSDHHSHNTRSKDTVGIIKSDTNWGLLRSLNSALLEWNALPMEMRNLSYNAFRISLHNRFKF